MTQPITHVATTDVTDMMAPGPERRMELPGFDPEFVDFPHYIIRITERIWHDKEVELCLNWYADDCVIHTLGGDISGAQTVVDNTWATLSAFPDRRLDADNVIWSDAGEGAFYSSHLITSKMTNEGDSEFGPATQRQVRVQTIAECLCKDNKVIEEWLVRDNLTIAQQLGFDANEIVGRQAKADQSNGFSLIDFHESNRQHVKTGSPVLVEPESASEIACKALLASWQAKDVTAMSALYDYRVNARYPGSSTLYGPDQLSTWLDDLWLAFPDLKLSIDHIAEIPYLGEARDVSIRWTATGTHQGLGRYGPPTNAPIFLLAVTHFRIMRGRVREETCIWDDLALRRQIETARL